MKNRKGMIPNYKQKKILAEKGYDPKCWNVVKEDEETILIVNKASGKTEIVKK